MTEGVLRPMAAEFAPDSWAVHSFRGNAGLVFDTKPGDEDALSVMVIGHADKIRMQVRSIGEDGKIWIETDSFLPTTLIGHEVLLFSEGEDGNYRVIEGGTIEALGAIHFATPEMRTGRKGVTKEMMYLELGLHGEKRKKQVEALGIRSGDSILLKRPIRRGFAPDSYYGAYLDNGLGCFLVMEVMRLLAENKALKNVRFLGAAAAYEEIGRLGSRVLVGEFRPDIVIGVDVAHDLEAAPHMKGKRFSPVKMGAGATLAVGSIANAYLNQLIQAVGRKHDIAVQPKAAGRDTGTDAMAAVFASVDAAASSIGFPIRHMHTISECGHTGDILSAIWVIYELLHHLDGMHKGAGANADDFRAGHPRLDRADALEYPAS